jgi:hypothetical protein
MPNQYSPVYFESITFRIFLARSHKFMPGSDLADLGGVSTSAFNLAVPQLMEPTEGKTRQIGLWSDPECFVEIRENTNTDTGSA